MAESSLLFVTRRLLPIDHQGLRAHMPETNRLGDLGIRWRKLGEVGLMLLDADEYRLAAHKRHGKLATEDAVALADTFNANLLPAMPGKNGRITAPIVDVDLVGTGRIRSIAYILNSGQITRDRAYVTASVDRLNGVNTPWQTPQQLLSVATVLHANIQDEEDMILDTFWDFAPDEVTLLPAVAESL